MNAFEYKYLVNNGCSVRFDYLGRDDKAPDFERYHQCDHSDADSEFDYFTGQIELDDEIEYINFTNSISPEDEQRMWKEAQSSKFHEMRGWNVDDIEEYDLDYWGYIQRDGAMYREPVNSLEPFIKDLLHNREYTRFRAWTIADRAGKEKIENMTCDEPLLKLGGLLVKYFNR